MRSRTEEGLIDSRERRCSSHSPSSQRPAIIYAFEEGKAAKKASYFLKSGRTEMKYGAAQRSALRPMTHSGGSQSTGPMRDLSLNSSLVHISVELCPSLLAKGENKATDRRW